MGEPTDVSVVECDTCGTVTISCHQDTVINEMEKHDAKYPEHQTYLHVLESKDSRRL